MKRTVLYIGNFSFPLGNAAGKRVYANGKLLKELGYNVIFIGLNKELKSPRSLEETKKEYDDFTFYEFPYPQNKYDWLNYKKRFSMLTSFLRQEKIIDDLSIVIYYGSPSLSLFISKLQIFCKKKDIKVIADCVDWLTTKTNNPLFDIVKWADNTYQKAFVNKRSDGVLAISSYLSNYYKKSGCSTVIIPPLSPTEFVSADKLNTNRPIEKKVLSYAGLPFRKGQRVTDCSKLKDRIDKTIKLLYLAKQKGSNFIFNIYGFTKDEYLTAIPSQKKYIDALGENIIFHGYKPNQEIVEDVNKSDFTILIRDVNRDTTAGFPTKISESISCGTPVITTNTSDLESFIVVGSNGFFIDNDDEQKSLVVLKQILSMSKEDVMLMKDYCFNSKKFYYKTYEKELNDFIESVLK